MTQRLETYDLDWQTLWTTANVRCEILRITLMASRTHEQRLASAAELHAATDTLNSAFHARFRTMDDYHRFRLMCLPASPGGDEPAAAFPDQLTLQELRARHQLFLATTQVEAPGRERPVAQDLQGLGAFGPCPAAGAERHIERLDLELRGLSPPVFCWLAIETSPHGAHLCFIRFGNAASIFGTIAALATEIYRVALPRPRGWRGLLGRRRLGEYLPEDLTIYGYDPPTAFSPVPGKFERVTMRWVRFKGFTSLDRHPYASVPAWLAGLANHPASVLTESCGSIWRWSRLVYSRAATVKLSGSIPFK